MTLKNLTVCGAIFVALAAGTTIVSMGAATSPATAPSATTSKPAAALDTPEAAVHELMLAMLAGDQERINRCTWPDEGREILAQNAPTSAAERLVMEVEYRNMPLTRLKVGDTVKLAGGKSVVMDATRATAEVQQLTNPELPFPFSVELDGTEWKVDARPLIASRKAAAAAKARAATQTKPAAASRPATTKS